MRQIKRLVIHCTGTKPEVPISVIQDYWEREKKWSMPGYHYIIRANGNIVKLASLRDMVNGAKGYNYDSIHIAYIGGLSENGKYEDTRTIMQKDSLNELVYLIVGRFPDIEIVGHRDLNPKKECPCFDVKSEFIDVKQLKLEL